MASVILAETSASVSELKKNPMATVAAGEGFPVAILNRNEPAFYCVPAKSWEALMDKLEDIELNAIADAMMMLPCTLRANNSTLNRSCNSISLST